MSRRDMYFSQPRTNMLSSLTYRGRQTSAYMKDLRVEKNSSTRKSVFERLGKRPVQVFPNQKRNLSQATVKCPPWGNRYHRSCHMTKKTARPDVPLELKKTKLGVTSAYGFRSKVSTTPMKEVASPHADNPVNLWDKLNHGTKENQLRADKHGTTEKKYRLKYPSLPPKFLFSPVSPARSLVSRPSHPRSLISPQSLAGSVTKEESILAPSSPLNSHHLPDIRESYSLDLVTDVDDVTKYTNSSASSEYVDHIHWNETEIKDFLCNLFFRGSQTSACKDTSNTKTREKESKFCRAEKTRSSHFDENIVFREGLDSDIQSDPKTGTYDDQAGGTRLVPIRRISEQRSHWRAKSQKYHDLFRQEQKWRLLQSRRGVVAIQSAVCKTLTLQIDVTGTSEDKLRMRILKRKAPSDGGI